jgi:hypothetical protein
VVAFLKCYSLLLLEVVLLLETVAMSLIVNTLEKDPNFVRFDSWLQLAHLQLPEEDEGFPQIPSFHTTPQFHFKELHKVEVLARIVFNIAE